MKVVAFLPAKGTSERIISKNLKILNGKPLFLHTLEKLTKCDFIDEVYLDSESDEILNYAPYLKYIPMKRKKELANNKTDGHQLFRDEISKVEADIYIQILGTSPFISAETIKKGIDILVDHDEYDSVVLMKKEKQYLWNNGQPVYDKFNIPNSVTLPDTLIESMGLYIIRGETARDIKMRYGKSPYMLTASAIETIDVNYPDEFELADIIMNGLTTRENLYFSLLSNFLSSAIFSDILNEMSINSTITGLITNFPDKKIMGRANTLKIKAINNEDYHDIYNGLKTYEKITPGEIIVVENEIADRAYFGELNANLATRAGAIGTIVSSVTRDINEVSKLDYPVYSRGYCSSDVKGYGVVEGHQIPVTIDNVKILPGDIIFADNCGIVRIPQKFEKSVINKAIKTAETEKNILKKIMNMDNAMDIYKQEGEF